MTDVSTKEIEGEGVLEQDEAVEATPLEATPTSLEDRIVIGMGCCRRREWHSAADYLSPLVGMRPEEHRNLPARAWSCLGLAVARRDRKYEEAIKLCAKALRVAPKDPENHLNLAWCLLIARRRQDAATALLRGRELSPKHAGLLELHQNLGIRQPTLISFLSRTNALNRWLGQARFKRSCDRAVRDHFALSRLRSPATSRAAPLLALLVFGVAVGSALYFPSLVASADLSVGDVVFREAARFGTITAYDEARSLGGGDPVPALRIRLAEGGASIWMSEKAARRALRAGD